MNVGINAITALTGIKNGFIAATAGGRGTLPGGGGRGHAGGSGQGFCDPRDMVERVLAIAQATAVNRSSMGQDVDHQKRTEIDAINGAIVAFGERLRVPTPVNRTLTQLVKILEASYLVSNE